MKTHYNPKIHNKTKGGHGFGMKKNAKVEKYSDSGVHLASIFGWSVPKELQHIKDVIDAENKRNYHSVQPRRSKRRAGR